MSEGEQETAPEQWWVPGRLGGMREGRMSSPSTMLSPQGRKASAQLAVTGLREDFAAARGDEKAGGERCPAREEWGLAGGDDRGASSPPSSSCTPHLGEENPEGIQLSKKRLWVLSRGSSTLMQGGPFMWD